jgi:hypothetical protein
MIELNLYLFDILNLQDKGLRRQYLFQKRVVHTVIDIYFLF